VGPFSSLNASLSVGDVPEAVAENLRRLAHAAGVETGALLTVSQVHGDTVVKARPGVSTEADALWTDEPGQAVGVRTADCVPIVVEDRVGRRVAAVHAGWRGVLNGVLLRTLRVLQDQGTRLDDVRLVVGPCARACCFEVDGALPDQFAEAFGPSVVLRPRGQAKPHLDLPLALVTSLARVGVPAASVAVVPGCTMCDTRFFSHRRDRGVTGRHLSFITCRFGGDPSGPFS
jgi:hypothetical protein